MKTFKNKNFTKRDNECANVVFCFDGKKKTATINVKYKNTVK